MITILRLDGLRSDQSDLSRFARGVTSPARFAGNEFEVLFQRWKVRGDAVLADCGGHGFLAAIADGRGALLTDQLPLSYDRFGTRAGVS
jgi:hypothetical protein